MTIGHAGSSSIHTPRTTLPEEQISGDRRGVSQLGVPGDRSQPQDTRLPTRQRLTAAREYAKNAGGPSVQRSVSGLDRSGCRLWRGKAIPADRPNIGNKPANLNAHSINTRPRKCRPRSLAAAVAARTGQTALRRSTTRSWRCGRRGRRGNRGRVGGDSATPSATIDTAAHAIIPPPRKHRTDRHTASSASGRSR